MELLRFATTFNKILLRACRRLSVAFILLFWGVSSLAVSNQSLVYQGRIVRPDGTLPNAGSITFTLAVYSPAPAQCLLYSETHTVDMTGSKGLFSLNVGTGSRTDGGAHSFNKIFVNGGTLTGLTCSTGNSYTAGATDDRSLVASFVDAGQTISLSAMSVKSVPFALQAHEVDGWGLNNLVKVSSVGSPTTFTTTEMANAKALSGAACALNQILKWNGSAWACAGDATGGSPSDASYGAKGILQVDTDAATSGLTIASGVLKLSDTGVTAASYGTATKVPTISVDAQGRITTASDTTIALPVSQLTQSSANSNDILKWNGSNWAPVTLASLLPVTTKGDVLIHNGTTATRLPVGSDGMVLAADSAQASGLKWAAVGNVSGTGTANSIPKFTGAGSIGNSAITDNGTVITATRAIASTTNPIATGAAVDLSVSNSHTLASVGGSTITLTNMQDGGVYNIVIEDTTSRTYTFSGCTNSYFRPANTATTAATRTVYGVMTLKKGANWDCYISWSSGFQ